MTDVKIIFAKNLKNFREILGLSQMELAEKAGCSPTLIGKIETMKRFPSANTINCLANTLNITPAELFEDIEKSKAAKSMLSKQKRISQLKSKLNKAIDEYFK